MYHHHHHHHHRHCHHAHFVFVRTASIAPIDFIFTSRKLLTFDIYFCVAVTRCDIYNLTDSMLEWIQTMNGGACISLGIYFVSRARASFSIQFPRTHIDESFNNLIWWIGRNESIQSTGSKALEYLKIISGIFSSIFPALLILVQIFEENSSSGIALVEMSICKRSICLIVFWLLETHLILLLSLEKVISEPFRKRTDTFHWKTQSEWQRLNERCSSAMQKYCHWERERTEKEQINEKLSNNS